METFKVNSWTDKMALNQQFSLLHRNLFSKWSHGAVVKYELGKELCQTKKKRTKLNANNYNKRNMIIYYDYDLNIYAFLLPNTNRYDSSNAIKSILR